MSLWNLGTIMSFATAAIGNRADLASSVVSTYANQAALDVNFAVEPQDVESIAVSSTTSGENLITLPSDFQALLSLSNISSSPVQVLTKYNYYDVDSGSTQIGTPQYYMLYDGMMQLWPSPDSAYSLQLRYQSRPSVLTLAASLPSFDTRFSLAWMYRTAALCAYHVKDFETASLFDQKYMVELATKPSDLALRQRDRMGQNVNAQIRRKPKWTSGDDFDNTVLFPPSLYGP